MLTSTAFTLLAFFFSTLLSTTDGARSFGILWYIMTFIAVPILVAVYFYSAKDADKQIIEGLSLIVSGPYYKGVSDLITASSGGRGKGMVWERKDPSSATASDIDYAYAGWSGGTGAW